MASDSIRARPMIIAVWIRVAAPGCRAIPSSAAAMALPCPRPHRPAARAIPMPAATTVNGPTHEPWDTASPAAWADRALPVSAARNVRIPRTMRTLPPPLVMGGHLGPGARLAVLGLEGPRDVEQGEHHEDECLEERHQDLEGVEEADREDDRHRRAEPAHDIAEDSGRSGESPGRQPHRHEEDNRQEDVPPQHVAEETQGEGEGQSEVADQLDGDQEGGDGRHGSREVLEVGAEPMLPDADPVVRAEHHEGAGQVRVQVVRGGGEPRHEAQQVRGEDEETQGRDQGQKGPALRPHDVVDQGEDELQDGLHHVLDSPRHEGGPSRHAQREPHEHEHDKPRERHVMRDPEGREDRGLELVHQPPAQRACSDLAEASPATTTATGSPRSDRTSPRAPTPPARDSITADPTRPRRSPLAPIQSARPRPRVRKAAGPPRRVTPQWRPAKFPSMTRPPTRAPPRSATPQARPAPTAASTAAAPASRYTRPA